jgi:hypothetical protein
LYGSPEDVKEEGIIIRSARAIFDLIDELDHDTECTVSLSVLEIYNEKLHDLLSKDTKCNANGNISNTNNLNGTTGTADCLSGVDQNSCKNVSTGTKLRIRDTPKERSGGTSCEAGVWVEGLTESVVRSVSSFQQCMNFAMKKRATGEKYQLIFILYKLIDMWLLYEIDLAYPPAVDSAL